MLVLPNGKQNPKITVPLPVAGLLNPKFANPFDDFIKTNSAYSLTPATIAGNLDKDFDELHPKQLRRFVLGPFYSAGVTEHNSKVTDILDAGAEPGQCLAADLDVAGNRRGGRTSGKTGPVEFRAGPPGISHRHR